MKHAGLTASAVIAGLLCSTNCFSFDARPSLDVPVTPAAAVSPDPAASVPGSRSGRDLLNQVYQANDELYTTLQSFVCSESIQRFKGRINESHARPLDTLTAKVSFENGTEQYSEVRQDEHPRPSISSISGAWSVGEFGTLLRQTQALLQTHAASFERYVNLGDTPAAVYVLEISEQDSPWDLVVRSQHFRIPFRTGVWVSRTTGQVLKIERISTAVPREMGISELRWGLSLQEIQMNDKTWLLPRTGRYEVLYEESDRKEWNLMTFSDYHRYGSEVAVRYQ